MSLSTGMRHGSYEILSAIGAGGMGEVYRARDTSLKRDVALKILPDSFATDAERLARFQREAEVLASLNHPNIAAIYGLEHANGVKALVMELVEGEDLAERIARGPIPLDEALPIARQIAEALEAAHEQGIIHRDLKPANIKVRADGTVKVLDFGLAKALEPMSAVGADAMASPTITSPAMMTSFGVLLGTAAYMSPEQARGRPVDKRADIWAFGAVFFEMLTGRRLFAGDTVSDTLAAVLTRDPDWSKLPPTTPLGLRRLLEWCLHKNVARRLRDIGDASPTLQGLGEWDERTSSPISEALRRRRGAPVAWTIAVLAVAAAMWAGGTRLGRPEAAEELTYIDIAYPPAVEPLAWLGGRIAISPDGRTVGMIGVRSGVRRALIRQLDQADAYELPETSGANWLAFSPDGASVAFMPSSGAIVTLSLRDQQRKSIASGGDIVGSATWVPAGVVFTRDRALWIVPAEGGKPRALTQLDVARNEVLHFDPSMLPGGRMVLFSSMTKDPGTSRIEAVSVDSGKRAVIAERATTPAWSPTGHILFARDEAVMAAPADAQTGAIRGPAVTVIPRGVIAAQGSGTMGFRFTSAGTLLYVPYEAFTRRVFSVSRDGAALDLGLPLGRYSAPRVSPDGRRLLLEDGRTVTQALDLARGTTQNIAPSALGTGFATWTTDGQRVVFRRFNLLTWIAADGSAREESPAGVITNDYPSGPGVDGDSILMVRVQPDTAGDVYLLSLSNRYPPRPLVNTKAYEGGAQLSHDGRWLLYQSNTSGASEIYVRRYPALDRAWPVSAGGGVQPRWNGNSEICYRAGSHLMAVAFDGAGHEPTFGKPQSLFADEYDFGQTLSIANYDITHNGRFIMLRGTAASGNLRVVVNWKNELVRLIRAGGVK
jgi:eukaryotic-like serine/threonine-protein kinase